MARTFFQSADERLDYDFDFTDAIGSTDVISTATITVDQVGLTTTTVVSGRVVKVWVEDGTAEEIYVVDLHVVTTAGREKCHSFKIQIRPACH